ncbi:MAG: hypothetical protein J6A38_01750 [Clostridia bacterium]|nr:hypothetical protein [Clostridia bacterium]
MKKSAFVSDVFFAFFISSLFTLCLFRYLRIPFSLSVTLSVLCGILTALAVATLLRAKRKNLYLKRTDETQKEKLLLHLALLSDEKKTEFFQRALAVDEPVGRFAKLRLFTQTEFYFLHFSLLPVSADDVIKYARWKTKKQKVVFCAQIDEGAMMLCNRLGIRVKTGEEIYTLLKDNERLPERFLGEENAENKRKRKLRLWLAKRNSKGFVTSGSLVLFTSLWTPFPYYYLVFGSCLLIVAVLTRIFGYE